MSKSQGLKIAIRHLHLHVLLLFIIKGKGAFPREQLNQVLEREMQPPFMRDNKRCSIPHVPCTGISNSQFLKIKK